MIITGILPVERPCKGTEPGLQKGDHGQDARATLTGRMPGSHSQAGCLGHTNSPTSPPRGHRNRGDLEKQHRIDSDARSAKQDDSTGLRALDADGRAGKAADESIQGGGELGVRLQGLV